MFENLRKCLSKRVCECLNVHLEDHPEDRVFAFFESVLGNIVYASGSFIRIDPDHIFIFLVYNFYMIVTPIITYFLIVYTLIFYPGDFENILSLLHLAVLMILINVSHVHMMFHREDGAVYVEKMLSLERNGKRRRNEDSSTRENLRLFFTKVFPPTVWLCWSLYMSSQPVYQYVINSKAFVLPFELWFPFDTHNILGFVGAIFIEALIVNCYCVLIITSIPAFLYFCNTMFDEYYMLIQSIRTMHDDTLSEYKNTEEGRNYKPTMSSFDLYRDAKFLECLRRRYNQIIHHHQTIISMFEDLQKLSGTPLTVVLGIGGFIMALGISGVLSGFGDFSLKVVFTVIVIINMFAAGIICYLGQQLTDLGENLRQELYFTNWYDWPEDMKRSLRIMLARTLEPLSLTSSFVTIKPNFETFATMINTAYSFINVLRAFQE